MSTIGTLRGMSTTSACVTSGASYRQLDYWVRRGYIRGLVDEGMPGSGRHRRWGADQVRMAHFFAMLARNGQAGGSLDDASPVAWKTATMGDDEQLVWLVDTDQVHIEPTGTVTIDGEYVGRVVIWRVPTALWATA